MTGHHFNLFLQIVSFHTLLWIMFIEINVTKKNFSMTHNAV